jgi:hypothetical protein
MTVCAVSQHTGCMRAVFAPQAMRATRAFAKLQAINIALFATQLEVFVILHQVSTQCCGLHHHDASTTPGCAACCCRQGNMRYSLTGCLACQMVLMPQYMAATVSDSPTDCVHAVMRDCLKHGSVAHSAACEAQGLRQQFLDQAPQAQHCCRLPHSNSGMCGIHSTVVAAQEPCPVHLTGSLCSGVCSSGREQCCRTIWQAVQQWMTIQVQGLPARMPCSAMRVHTCCPVSCSTGVSLVAPAPPFKSLLLQYGLRSPLVRGFVAWLPHQLMPALRSWGAVVKVGSEGRVLVCTVACMGRVL